MSLRGALCAAQALSLTTLKFRFVDVRVTYQASGPHLLEMLITKPNGVGCRTSDYVHSVA